MAGELEAVAARVEETRKQVAEQRIQLQEISVRLAVHQQMIDRQRDDLIRVRKENEDNYKNLTEVLSGLQTDVKSLVSAQSRMEGEEKARQKWVPITITLLSIVIAALGLALALAPGAVS